MNNQSRKELEYILLFCINMYEFIITYDNIIICKCMKICM